MQGNQDTHIQYSLEELQKMELHELVDAIPAGTQLTKSVIQVLLDSLAKNSKTVIDLIDLCIEREWKKSKRAIKYINKTLNVDFKATLSKYKANIKSLPYEEAAAGLYSSRATLVGCSFSFV